MKDKIEIEELHKNHIKVRLKDFLINNSFQSNENSDLKHIKKKKSLKYKDIIQ